jgi:hypothetical protein
MNETLRQLMNWVGIFLLVIFGSIFLLNFYQQGFFWKYMRVKGSRGKKLMVQVETLLDRYLAIGHIEEGFLVYKKRYSKDFCRLAVPEGAVYKDLGIHWINVDEKKNAIQKADYSVVEGHDAELTEALYVRALNKPTMIDTKTKVIIILLIVILICLFVLGVMNIQMYKKIAALNAI